MKSTRGWGGAPRGVERIRYGGVREWLHRLGEAFYKLGYRNLPLSIPFALIAEKQLILPHPESVDQGIKPEPEGLWEDGQTELGEVDDPEVSASLEDYQSEDICGDLFTMPGGTIATIRFQRPEEYHRPWSYEDLDLALRALVKILVYEGAATDVTKVVFVYHGWPAIHQLDEILSADELIQMNEDLEELGQDPTDAEAVYEYLNEHFEEDWNEDDLGTVARWRS